MASSDLVVRVTELSGKELQVTLGDNDTIFTLRQKVSNVLETPMWKLKMLHRGNILAEGMLKDLVEGDSNTLDVMAVRLATDQQVLTRSRELVKAFKRPFHRQMVEGRYEVNLDLIEGHRAAITRGEVDFHFQRENFLELVISNFPRWNVDEFVNLLLTAGASVNLTSLDRYTPLLTACARGFGQIAETLLNHGADPDAKQNGADALRSALKFFEACVVAGSCERSADFQLAKFCCHLRDLKIQKIMATLTPLEQVRLRLSQAATEMALLASPGFELSKTKVLKKIGLSEEEAEDFGADLWAGWPWAFLTFECDIPQSRHDFDKYFVYARARIMVYHVHESLNKPSRTEYSIDDTSSECGSVYTSNYHCDCEACCPHLYNFPGALEAEPLVAHYEAYKEQNRKWATAINNHRRSRRVPVASGSKRTSYSSRLAKKMPAAYRGFHVERALHGQQRKGGKFQLLKEELDFDVY